MLPRVYQGARAGTVKIAEALGTGASGVLTFSSIPGIYKNLEIEVVGRGDTAGTSIGIQLSLNGDTTAGDYDSLTIYNNSATTTAAAEVLGTVGYIACGSVPAASSTALLYSSAQIIIPDYAQATNYKNVRVINGGALSIATTLQIPQMIGGIAEIAAAITSLALTLGAGNWTVGSRATLYGRN